MRTTLRLRTCLVVLFCCLGAVSAHAQIGDTATEVYKAAQDSVFLVYLNDSSGNPTALGSAFLVAPRMLVTDAHVVDAGSPVLAVGPVRIPLKIVRRDEKNDLAILSVDIDLTSKPLPLAKGDVSPGEQIFAIGNPEGLEKTISQGIVSGIRTREGRNLIQITSPISHGSSGGPILNDRGEVIGVAVGMLQDGQNLNFAVPARLIKSLLAEKFNEASHTIDCGQNLDQLTRLFDVRANETYSDDPASPYQEDSHKLTRLLDETAAACRKPDDLAKIACFGTKSADFSEYGIKAARTLVDLGSSSASRSLLAYVLYDRAQNESFAAAFAKDGTEEKTHATQQYGVFLTLAGTEANGAAKSSKGSDLMVANYVLSRVRAEHEDYPAAVALASQVAESKTAICGQDLALNAFRSLVANNEQANNPAAAEKWFRVYASKYPPEAYEWDREGDRRRKVGDESSAADAYETAAGMEDDYAYDYCYAATNRLFQNTPDKDAVMSDGRKCIDASVKNTNKYSQKQFEVIVPTVYRSMADVLESRGVYQQALEYVKEALGSKPDDAFALDSEAKIFEDLDRYSECISASQAAIRASDGKYPWMQFRLGQCYFDTQNWSQAANSYRLAAEADKTDAVSAFNLGLSLSRQGYEVDAKEWFREALRRNPDSQIRAKIEAVLK